MLRRSRVHGGDRRLDRVGRRSRAPASARSHQRAAPRAIRARFHSERSWSSSRISSPVGVGARGAARFVQQHQRQQADRLGLGQQRDQQPPQPDRLAREIGPRQRVAGRGRVALVEDEVDDAAARRRAAPAARRAAGTS